MRKIFLSLLVVSVLTLAGCGIPTTIDVTKSVEPEVIMLTDQIDVPTAYSNALCLLNGVEEKAVSPISVMAMEAVMANGAKGDTLQEILSTYDIQDVLDLDNTVRLKLPLLDAKTSLWVKQDSYEKEFLQRTATFVGANVFSTNFDFVTVKDINGWMEQKEFIDDIDTDANMWLLSSVNLNLDISNASKKLRVDETGVVGMEAEFFDFGIGLAVLAPNDDTPLETYMSTLNGDILTRILESGAYKPFNVAVPNINVDQTVNVMEAVQDSGICAAFNHREADFTGVSDSATALYVSNMLQYQNLNITGYVPEGEIDAELGPEFLYVIYDLSDYSPLFIGVYSTSE